MKTALFACSLGLSLAAGLSAQVVTSAKSGLIHYTEGDVLLEDQEIAPKKGQFAEIKNGQVLKTGEGRAEVLVGYSGYLRIAENSSILMLDNRLSETRVQVLSGSLLVECPEIIKGNRLTFVAASIPLEVLKPGLYRIDIGAGGESSVKVYDGELAVGANEKPLVAKKGKMVLLGNELIATKFDAKSQDPLYRWASLRSDSLALANMSSARGLMDYRKSWQGGWMWNPWYNMFTYVPLNGIYYSPFGNAYYSPSGIYSAYYPVQSSGGGSGRGFNQNTYYDSGLGSMISPRSSASSGSVMSSGSVGSSGGGTVSASGGERGGGNAGSSRGDSSAGGRGR